MTVGQVEYLQDLSDGLLRISDFHISCIGFIYFRQVNATFGQVILQSTCPMDKCIQFEISKSGCVSNLTITGSDNGLSPGWHQAIIWTNAGILLIRTLGTKFSEILSEMHTFSFTKMHLKMSSVKWRPFCLSLNVLRSIFDKNFQTWLLREWHLTASPSEAMFENFWVYLCFTMDHNKCKDPPFLSLASCLLLHTKQWSHCTAIPICCLNHTSAIVR